MSHNLANQLREGTKESHTMAENTAFMKCFLKGIVEKEPLKKLLADFYFIYSAIEAELQRLSDHPVVGKIYFEQLNRKASLAEDLAFYYGDNWLDKIQLSPAGQDYVNRIHEIANHQPERLVSHAYVRYLGDLSGGQGLKKIIRSALNLPSEQGTAFYEFQQLPTPDARKNFKMQYREALDSLPINDEIAQKIVDEANEAFRFNRDVMHELETEVKAAIGDHVFELITRQTIPGSTEHPVGHGTVELVTAE